MGLTFTNNTIDKYFSFLKRLDNGSKKRLIIKLTESIETSEDNKIDLKDMYGAWEDTRDSDEIIKMIRESRVNYKNTIDL